VHHQQQQQLQQQQRPKSGAGAISFELADKALRCADGLASAGAASPAEALLRALARHVTLLQRGNDSLREKAIASQKAQAAALQISNGNGSGSSNGAGTPAEAVALMSQLMAAGGGANARAELHLNPLFAGGDDGIGGGEEEED
jgi:hypothetical protein